MCNLQADRDAFAAEENEENTQKATEVFADVATSKLTNHSRSPWTPTPIPTRRCRGRRRKNPAKKPISTAQLASAEARAQRRREFEAWLPRPPQHSKEHMKAAPDQADEHEAFYEEAEIY